MQVESFFHNSTNTFTYLVYDNDSKDGLIIDSVVDFDPIQSQISYASTKELLDRINELQLNIHYILETHVHADHLSGSSYIKEIHRKAKTGISEKIKLVQETFNSLLALPEGSIADGRQFDVLFKDTDQLTAGSLNIKTINTPGHTPACTCFLINEQTLFTGDSIFYPSFGTGRCDFPHGSAETLYDSIHKKIFTLADDIVIYVGHDYPAEGEEPRPRTTIKEQKLNNKHIKIGTSKEDFIKFRSERDKQLNNPSLLFQSVQFNMNAGKFADSNNKMSFYKMPVFTNKDSSA